MGINIGTVRTDLSMGYNAFRIFRIEIAKAFSADFGKKYEDYRKEAMLRFVYGEKEQLEQLDKNFNNYLKTVDVPEDIVDFLFQSDTRGKISYRTAMKLRDLCRKSKCKLRFGYSPHKLSMAEISGIFDDAVKHRCQVKWS